MPEARLERTDAGLQPAGDGWFVVNVRDTPWIHTEELGDACFFESRDTPFPDLGIDLNVLAPGQPNCMYHEENRQEAFLVLRGECIAIIEGEERPLEPWDFVHCPAGTRHVFVGAGSEPCVLLAVGKRGHGGTILYPVDDVALRHGAGVEQETTKPEEAYARFSGWRDRRPQPYRGGLPG